MNKIMERWVTKGILPTHLNRAQPQYIDATRYPESYHHALQLVDQVEEQFAALPSSIRDAAGNTATGLVELLQSPEKRDLAISLGLVPASPLPPLTTDPSASEADITTREPLPEQPSSADSNQ